MMARVRWALALLGLVALWLGQVAAPVPTIGGVADSALGEIDSSGQSGGGISTPSPVFGYSWSG